MMKKIYIASNSIYRDDYFAYKLKLEASEMGYQVLNKDITTYNQILEKKATSEYLISQCDIFIAVISDENPNVFYELGYASALGKLVLIVSDVDFELPEQIKQFSYLKFDNNLANSAFYNILNFLEKANISERQVADDIQNIHSLLQIMRNDLQVIDRISGSEFEEMFYNYFRNIEGIGVEKPRQTSDYGFDLMLFNWNGFSKSIVEIKKYNRNSKVSVSAIQQVVGAMNIYEAEHAIIITTSEFTSSAKGYASGIGKKIDLWDLEYLFTNL